LLSTHVETLTVPVNMFHSLIRAYLFILYGTEDDVGSPLVWFINQLKIYKKINIFQECMKQFTTSFRLTPNSKKITHNFKSMFYIRKDINFMLHKHF